MPALSEIDALFDANLSNKDQVIVAGFALEDLVAKAIEDGLGERFAASYAPEQRARLREIHSRFEITVDDTFMEDVLSGTTGDPQEYPFQSRYNRLSEMEAQATEMQKGKPVMHIGTGWPGTAIGLYQQFGTPVTCVEINPEVAKKSKMALEKLGLYGEDKLQVVLADGSNLNTERYSAVILSAMLSVEDKRRIVRNMRNMALDLPSDPMLILRTPPDLARSLFYQELPTDLTSGNGLELIADTGSLISRDDHLRSLFYRLRAMAELRRGSDRIVMETAGRLNLPDVL